MLSLSYRVLRFTSADLKFDPDISAFSRNSIDMELVSLSNRIMSGN